MISNPNEMAGLTTGFVNLDAQTSGLKPGEFVVIAGRTGVGKTSLSLNIAEHVALNTHHSVAIFSLEIGSDQLALRLLASLSKLSQEKLKGGNLANHDWPPLTSALQRLMHCAIHIDDSTPLTAADIRTKAGDLASQCKATKPLGLIVIDYLQRLTGPDEDQPRSAQISDICQSLKDLAQELHLPIIALSQVSRTTELRPDKRPTLFDLRVAAIEPYADSILFIHRNTTHHPDNQDGETAEIIVAKQRNGPVGTVQLAFLEEHARFENLAARQSKEN